MQEIFIQPKRLIGYLSAFEAGYGTGIYYAALGRLQVKYPNEDVYAHLRNIVRGNIAEVLPISSRHLIELADECAIGVRPHTISHFTRRIGKIWWLATTPLYPDFWHEVWLYNDVSPFIMEDLKQYYKNSRGKSDEAFFRALNILVSFLHEHFYCQILIEKISANSMLFDAKYHPFAAIDNQEFLLLWGLIDVFCEWLSMPSKIQPSGKFQLIEIDEAVSTANRIIIKYPYDR